MYNIDLQKRKEEKNTVFVALETYVNCLSQSALSSNNIISCSNSAFPVNLKLQKTKRDAPVLIKLSFLAKILFLAVKI